MHAVSLRLSVTLTFGRVALAALLCLLPTLAGAAPATTPCAPDTCVDLQAAQGVLDRLLPSPQRAQLHLQALDDAGERYRVEGRAGDIRVQGSTTVALLVGVQAYLRQAAGVDIGWPGDSLARLPAVLPAPSAPLSASAVVPDRVALNDVDDGYTDAYASWDDWQRRIDLMALHGFNAVFMPVGSEVAYLRTFAEAGYSREQLQAWIPGAAHQPWWLLQNMAGYGGPVSDAQLNRRALLGRQIVARLKELGMAPILPGYAGMLPPGFAARRPGANIVPQGKWVGFDRPDWLDPRDPQFAPLAAAFYRHQAEVLGTAPLYKMDLLHEGGNAGGVPVGAASAQVMAALQAARPGARWVLLGWQHNPRSDLLEAVDRSRLLVVDGLSDRYMDLDRERDWPDTPYAFGTIPNFGGHTALGTNATVWTDRYARWRAQPGSHLRGIAWLPEASGIDPAGFALFSALAWEPVPTDAAQWLTRYARWRYGGFDAHAQAAWSGFAASAYAMASDNWSEPHDSLFAARPGWQVRSGAQWSPPELRYDPNVLHTGVCELLQVAPALRHSSAYRYDLVSLAAQALGDRARQRLPQIEAAYTAKDAARLKTLTTRWLDDMTLLDRLLATDEHFVLGHWLENARTTTRDRTERTRQLRDQRALITVWGPREAADGAGLHDYAGRTLSGLVSGLYQPRWRRYFEALQQSLADGTPLPAIDWFAMEQAWVEADPPLPVTAQGDPLVAAQAAMQALGGCR